MIPYNNKYEKLNDNKKPPRSVVIILTLMLIVSAAQLGLTCYLTYEGYRIVTDNSDSFTGLKQFPVNEISEYVTQTFHAMKRQNELTPVENTMKNVHESANKLRELVFAQEETSDNLRLFVSEAVGHKALFKTTLDLALKLQAPLKGIGNVVSPQNQIDISAILHKVKASLSKMNDNELNSLMLKATTLATDMDKAIIRFEGAVDRLHNI